MSLWWLSFADPEKPQGTRFLGVAIVEIEDVEGQDLRDRAVTVVRKAHALGCNPGGEVASTELHLDHWPNDQRVALAKAPKHTLLSKEDLKHYDLI